MALPFSADELLGNLTLRLAGSWVCAAAHRWLPARRRICGDGEPRFHGDKLRAKAGSRTETARDVARRIATTDQYERSRCERKKVEMLFAHLKRILKLDRLRLRGLSGAMEEFTMAAVAQNLRRLAMLAPHGPPRQGAGAPA